MNVSQERIAFRQAGWGTGPAAHRVFAGWVATASFVAALMGCHSADHLTVEGQVFVNGSPLAEGSVVFSPVGGSNRPKVATEIRRGRFHTKKSDGLVAGTYYVRIYDNSVRNFPWDDPQAYLQAEASGQLPRQLIPPKYNEWTELVIDVSPNNRHFSFQLETHDKREFGL